MTYTAFVRKYHPQGYPAPFYAGCTKRVGGSRVTDLCRHHHVTSEDAQVCAEELAQSRNSRKEQGA